MVLVDAILLGGGSGHRFRAGSEDAAIPKQFQLLGNAPVFIHAVRGLLTLGCFRQVVVVVPAEQVEHAQQLLADHLPGERRALLRVVAGGERRQDSSALALEAVSELQPLPARVLIHDACRPFLSPSFLERIHHSLVDRSYAAWVPVVPVVETLKRVENEQVVETVDRALFQRVQTPQIFEFPVIQSLVRESQKHPERVFTDDASLCEYYGIPVGVFEGDPRNIKLTYRFELETLRHVFAEQAQSAVADAVAGSTQADANDTSWDRVRPPSTEGRA